MNTSRKTTLDRKFQLLNKTGVSQQNNSPFVTNLPSLRYLGTTAFNRKPFNASALLIQSSGDHHAKLGEYAARLFKEQSMTDVMIVVQSQEFKAHKAVLACYSPYFNDVLNKPGFNEVHYLQIPSVTAKAFDLLLNYMYTGELRVTCQELSEVYRASRRLGVKGAILKCVELLQVTEGNFQNMVYLYVTARKLDLLDASTRGFKLMVMNFEKMITTKEFLDLEIEQVIELFSADEIGARSEVIVFMAALKWLDYDYLEREEHIQRVFKCVRFSLMTAEEILACYHPPVLPGIMEIPEIRQTLLNATCYITAKSLGQENLFTQLSNPPRSFLFGGEPMILWDMSVFDSEKYEETKKQNAAIRIQAFFKGYMARKRLQEAIFVANYAATVIQSVFRGYRVRKTVKLTKSAMQKKGRSSKNFLLHMDSKSGLLKAYNKRNFEIFEPEIESGRRIVLYGMLGFNPEDEEPNKIFSFDASERSWNYVTQCLSPHHDARMAYLEGHIYIIGGSNPLHRTETGSLLPLKDCVRYHVGKQEWHEVPEMEEARSSHVVAVFNEQILAIGGKNEEKEILSSIEKYDTSVGKWKPFSPPLPEPRMAMGYTIHKGMLWVAGGITYDGESVCIMDSVWCLDHRICSWTKKISLPQPVAFPTLISDGNNLFCLGGATRPLSNDREDLESTDKIYCYEKGRWVEQQSMPVQGHSIIACNIGETIFVLDGFNSQTMAPIQSSFSMDLKKDLNEHLENISSKPPGVFTESTIAWQ